MTEESSNKAPAKPDAIDGSGEAQTTRDGIVLPFAAPESAEGASRFAVYDRQLGQYVGGVTSKRADADEAAKGNSALVVVGV